MDTNDKIPNLYEYILKECREKKFTIGEFEELVFKLQMALDNRRAIDKELF